jgi:hypothetical protein
MGYFERLKRRWAGDPHERPTAPCDMTARDDVERDTLPDDLGAREAIPADAGDRGSLPERHSHDCNFLD